MRKFAWLIPCTLVALAAAAVPAHAQAFGKNKVSYETLHWSVLETPHVRLHYYAQEESLARRLASVAESVCVEYDGRFRLQFRQPVPILLYSTHHLFQQTNATPGFISEGVGGLTELIRGRVLIPHNGSWARLVWVTRHELTHAYMLEKLSQVAHDHHRPSTYAPPLWFTEGLAEWVGTHWDEDAEGLLRDAMLSGKAMPLTRSEPIEGTVLMYKEGQSFLSYFAGVYGPEKVFDMLDSWWRADDFPTLFRIMTGRRVEDVDEEWFEGLKRHYYPELRTTTPSPRLARRASRHGDFNLGVRAFRVTAPDTALRFCYFAAGETGIDLVLDEPKKGGGRQQVRLLRGGVSPQFESFHLFNNRPGTSASGLVTLSSKQGGRDVLYVLDSRRHDVVRRIELPNLVAIQYPAMAPGDTAIVFSAQDYSGRSDLYRVSWPGGSPRLERLTNDDFDDIEPDVSPDGRWVVFASDRGSPNGGHRLWRLSLAGGAPEPVGIPPGGEDREPVYSPDGKWIAFRSTRGGTPDLWVRPAEPSSEARRVTRLQGAAWDADWLPDGGGLLFVGQEGIEFEVYRMRFKPDTLKTEPEPPLPSAQLAADPPDFPVAPEPPHVAAPYTGPRHAYERRFGLDIVTSGLAYAPGIDAGAAQAQAALSDVLGNEQLYFFIANDADQFGNFWDGFQGSVTYINRAQRLNYGIGVFRLTEVYDADLDAIVRERRIGMTGLVSYPIDKFFRIDATMVFRHADDHRLRNGNLENLDLFSEYLAVVRDNTVWSYAGPIAGQRWYLAGGYTRDLTSEQGSWSTAYGEWRGYRRPVPRMVSATRLAAEASFGPDAQRQYIGGPWVLPGYDARVVSGTRTALVSQEFRMPLLRGLVLGVPSPWELPGINVAGFADMAWGWNRYGEAWFVDQLGSVGYGLYMGGGVFPAIRWNWAFLTPDFQHYARRPVMQFLITYDF
jgi:Tol biopolymer transport system component